MSSRPALAGSRLAGVISRTVTPAISHLLTAWGNSFSRIGASASDWASAVATNARHSSAVFGRRSIGRRGADARLEIDRRSCGLTCAGGGRRFGRHGPRGEGWAGAAHHRPLPVAVLTALFPTMPP